MTLKSGTPHHMFMARMGRETPLIVFEDGFNQAVPLK